MTAVDSAGATDVFAQALQPASSKSAYRSFEVLAVVGDDAAAQESEEYRGTCDYVSVTAPNLYMTADEADRAADLLRRAATELRGAKSGGAA